MLKEFTFQDNILHNFAVADDTENRITYNNERIPAKFL